MTVRHPSRPRPGTTTIGQVAAAGATMVKIACRRCDRHGRLSVARLIQEWGEHASCSDIMEDAAVDCPRRGETRIYELCQVCSPTLKELFYRPKEPGRRE